MAVIGVVGGSGGVGASSFAALVARVCPGTALVDLDVDGGGVDVLLGLESAPGARWSGVRLAGGELDPQALRSGLVPWGGCAVLAADVDGLAPAAVTQAVEVAARGGPVVLDLPRRACAERAAAVALCDVVVIVVRADVAGLVAGHAVVGGLCPAGVPVGVVVRPGEVEAPDAARLVGGRLLGELPTVRGRRGLDLLRPPRRLQRLAAGVVSGADPAVAA